MAEIGSTLREARMRAHIDITEVEARTKIRAKYLRALENEEWDLLPGPTFVKSFLRTYAEFLDLDPRLLVEEYRQRYERPAGQDMTPSRPPGSSQGRGRRQGREGGRGEGGGPEGRVRGGRWLTAGDGTSQSSPEGADAGRVARRSAR